MHDVEEGTGVRAGEGAGVRAGVGAGVRAGEEEFVLLSYFMIFPSSLAQSD